MEESRKNITLDITVTKNLCPSGEKEGHKGMNERKTPVLSCEGACIRGEIARQAANMLSKQPGFGRACHGEVLTVPGSSIARWVKRADKVVLIDGCFLRCHGRVLERLLEKGKLREFDALAVYKKYTDVFDPADVPEAERLEAARQVAEDVADRLESKDQPCCSGQARQECCGG